MRTRNLTPINRSLLLSIAVLLAGVTVMGQDRDIFRDNYTSGSPNGRAWEEFSDGAKTGYLLGFFNAVEAATSLAERYVAPTNKQNHELVQHLVDQGLLVQLPTPEGAKLPETIREAIEDQFIGTSRSKIGDVHREIDKLYADTENLLLPIPVAIQFCALKLRGTATNAQLEQFLIRRRKDASAPEENKP